MIEIGLIVAGIVGLSVSGVLVFRRIRKLEDNLQLVMNILQSASPALGRRLVEDGTQVILPERWEDEEVYEDIH